MVAEALIQELEQESATTRRVLERIPTDRLGWKPMTACTGRADDRQGRHDPLRWPNLNHLYHHRGQLAVYLRLLDVPVPSIYGPSADESR